MGTERFDIIFSGELLAGTNERVARAHLQRRFGLSGAALERLFQGRAVSIKRGVDADTAARYRRLFEEAGALIRIDPSSAPAGNPESGRQMPVAETEGQATVSGQSGLAFSTETGYLEEWPEPSPPDFDLGHLSLVAEGWTFEDCEPPLLPVPLPDTSHLSLVDDGAGRSSNE